MNFARFRPRVNSNLMLHSRRSAALIRMYKNINAASRIHALLDAANKQPSVAVHAMWAGVFGVKGTNDAETVPGVLAYLHWMHLEVATLESQLRRANISPHLWEGALARVRHLISPLLLPQDWQSQRRNLGADVLLALAFCSELLPDEELAITPEDLADIATQVNQLSATLATSNLPEALRRVIQHHVNLIITALAQYKVFGAKALREAAQTALGELVVVKDKITSPQAAEEVSRLDKLWRKVNTTVDTALKLEKLGQLGGKVWETVAGWLS